MLTFSYDRSTRILKVAPTAEDLGNLENTITIYDVTHMEEGPESLPDRPWHRLFNGSELIGHISDMSKLKEAKEKEKKGEQTKCTL